MDRRYVWRFQVLDARVLFLQGHWSEAAALIARAREHGSRTILPELAIAVGDFDAAERFLARDRSKWRSDGSGRLDQPELPVELALWRGALTDARACFERGLQLLDQSDEPLPLARLCVAGIRTEAELDSATDADAAASAGHRQRAEALLEQLDQLARLHPVRSDGYGRELRALHATATAECSRLRAPADAAATQGTDRWTAAIAAWEQIGMPYPSAYAHLRLGEAHLALGSRDQAATHLRIADTSAAQLGAGPLQAAVEAAAQRGRITLHDRTAGVPGTFADWAAQRGLTPREQQVLRLVVRGCSNREIGEQLYIAESTASVHVSRILRKLDTRTRAETISLVLTTGVIDGDQP
jgi:DNA-binding CsgD family transcriptional regulator